MLQSVGFETYRRSGPASSLFFEVYRKGSETRVVTHYRTEDNPDLRLFVHDQASEDFFELVEDVFSEFAHVFGDMPARRICDLKWDEFEALSAAKEQPFELAEAEEYLRAMSRQLNFQAILDEFETKYKEEMDKRKKHQKDDL